MGKSQIFITARKIGWIQIIMNKWIEEDLEDVLYCSDVLLIYCLSEMQGARKTVILDKVGETIVKAGENVMQGRLINNQVNVEIEDEISKFNSVRQSFHTTQTNYELWYQRLGYVEKIIFLLKKI